MKINIPVGLDWPLILRVVSCILWGIGGILTIPSSPIIGSLSIIGALLFLVAAIIEKIDLLL